MDMMNQDYHEIEDAELRRKIVPTALFLRLHKRDAVDYKAVYSVSKQLPEYIHLPVWLHLQISQKHLCVGVQGHFITCRSLNFLTKSSSQSTGK